MDYEHDVIKHHIRAGKAPMLMPVWVMVVGVIVGIVIGLPLMGLGWLGEKLARWWESRWGVGY